MFIENNSKKEFDPSRGRTDAKCFDAINLSSRWDEV